MFALFLLMDAGELFFPEQKSVFFWDMGERWGKLSIKIGQNPWKLEKSITMGKNHSNIPWFNFAGEGFILLHAIAKDPDPRTPEPPALDGRDKSPRNSVNTGFDVTGAQPVLVMLENPESLDFTMILPWRNGVFFLDVQDFFMVISCWFSQI